MKKHLSFIFFILANILVFGQVPLQWSVTVDTLQNQLHYSRTNMAVTANNKSAILYRNDSQLFDELAFYNINGSLIFRKNFANDSSYMYCLATDKQNNIYVVGEKTRQGISVGNTIIKFDSIGTLLWKRVWHQYANPGVEYPVKCLVDSHGNIIVTGQTVSMPNANDDIYVISYDASGNFNWQFTYNYPVTMSLDVVTDMEIDKNDNIYIGGYTPNSFATYLSDFTIIKLNKLGAQKWINKTGYTTLGGNSSNLRSLVLDNDGTAYACGYLSEYNSSGIAKSKFVMTKVDTVGSLVWHETSYIDSSAVAEDIAIDKVGNIYVYIASNIDSTYDIMGSPAFKILKSILRIHKYSKNKNLMWTYTDTALTQNIYTLKVLNDKVGAFSITNNKNKVTLLDTSGNFKWNYLYDEPILVTSGPRLEYLDMTKYAMYSFFSSTWHRTKVYVVLNKYEFDIIATSLNSIKNSTGYESWFYDNSIYFSKNFTGTLELLDASGKLISKYLLNNENTKALYGNANGLYYIKFIPKDNSEYWEPKKMVLTN